MYLYNALDYMKSAIFFLEMCRSFFEAKNGEELFFLVFKCLKTSVFTKEACICTLMNLIKESKEEKSDVFAYHIYYA